jgi:hypothetical protein
MLHKTTRYAALVAATVLGAVLVSTGGAAHADLPVGTETETWHDPGASVP